MNSIPASRLARLSHACVVVGALSLVVGISIAVLQTRFAYEIAPRSMRHVSGHMYEMQLPVELAIGDYLTEDGVLVQQSKVYVLEDGKPIGSSSPRHADIDAIGGGLYSHWGKQLRFSTSDNSDPLSNGRIYAAVIPASWPVYVIYGAEGLLALCAWVWLTVFAIRVRLWAGARIWFARLSPRRALGRRRDAIRFDWVWVQFVRGVLAGNAVVLIVLGLSRLEGAPFWLVSGVACAAGLSVLLSMVGIAIGFWGRNLSLGTYGRLAMSGMSLGLVFAMAEVALGVRERMALQVRTETPAVSLAPVPGQADTSRLTRLTLPDEVLARVEARKYALTMPKEWEWRPVEVEGAIKAGYWHEALHLTGPRHFRRSTPFPERDPDQLRIMLVGDSLTYGWGVDSFWNYGSQLERALNTDTRVEIINLGLPGRQSEDVLDIVVRFLPELDPDLVIYGVCLNDFLPSLMGQYVEQGYPFPLPEVVQKFFTDRTRIGGLFSEGYDALLRRFRLRTNFYDDILQDFAGYQVRFARDVAEMNEVVLSAGLPPIVAIVLDQSPLQGGRGHRIARVAERALRDAGMVVVPTDAFYETYNGQHFYVSAWERHPNEFAHQLYASMLLSELEGRADFAAYSRGQEQESTPSND